MMVLYHSVGWGSVRPSFPKSRDGIRFESLANLSDNAWHFTRFAAWTNNSCYGVVHGNRTFIICEALLLAVTVNDVCRDSRGLCNDR